MPCSLTRSGSYEGMVQMLVILCGCTTNRAPCTDILICSDGDRCYLPGSPTSPDVDGAACVTADSGLWNVGCVDRSACTGSDVCCQVSKVPTIAIGCHPAPTCEFVFCSSSADCVESQQSCLPDSVFTWLKSCQ